MRYNNAMFVVFVCLYKNNKEDCIFYFCVEKNKIDQIRLPEF